MFIYCMQECVLKQHFSYSCFCPWQSPFHTVVFQSVFQILYMGYHIVFAIFCPTYLTQHNVLKVHVVKIQSIFIFLMSEYYSIVLHTWTQTMSSFLTSEIYIFYFIEVQLILNQFQVQFLVQALSHVQLFVTP